MSYMARYGERLIDNGWPVLPIAPGTKSPGRFTRGAWSGYCGWQRHCTRATTEIEVGIWARWPGAGIGIACGAVAAVDIDELGAAKAADLEQRARAMLGSTPLMRVGRWPKRMLLYRTAEPFAPVTSPIEVLCLGRQLVAFADHPDTGAPYHWPQESPADVPLADLPVIDEAAVQRFLETLGGPVVRRLPTTTCGGSYTPSAELRGTPEAIADALLFIPNADLDYGSWVRIGMAIKGALGEAGRSMWLEFSRRSSKSGSSGKADTPETTWAGLKPARIGAGSIYHQARAAGWRPAPGLTLNGAPHPAQALLDQIKGHHDAQAA